MPQWFDAVARSFPDPNLKAMVRHEIGKPPGYAAHSDLEKITQLDSGNYLGIKKLNGLQYCTGLTDLQLASNFQISDVSPLAKLINLINLDLYGANVGDITPLSNIVNLRELDLSNNRIGDISPLSSLTGLKFLDLTGNQISDITPLANLTALRSLDLYGNKITDIAPLADNKGLTGCYVRLKGNSLNAESVNVYIPQLKQRGVRVDY
jgi:internalin A